MEQVRLDEHTVRKYLLGELAVDEREQIEERLLTDDSFFNDLTLLEDEVEDELIDEYISGDLTGVEREHFERIFLRSPERNEKLRLVKGLRDHVARDTHHPVIATEPVYEKSVWWHSLLAYLRFQNPLIGFSLALVLLPVSLYSLFLYVKSNRLDAELRQLQAKTEPPAQSEQLEQLRARNEALTESLRQSEAQRGKLEQEVASLNEREGPQPESPGNTKATPSRTPPLKPRSDIIASTLPLLRGRGSQGEQIKEINISRDATRVRLTLSLDTIAPEGYEGFQATVESRDEREVWKSALVKVRNRGGGNRIVLYVPANRLAVAGDYTVNLNGVTREGISEPIGMSLFRVTKR